MSQVKGKECVVHFLVRDPEGVNVSAGLHGSDGMVGGGGRYRVVCDRSLKIDGGYHRGSNAPQAAHCPKCRETEEWKEANHDVQAVVT